MSTIRDVAKKSGVSISTVSAVLNKSKFVSDELTTRVLAAVEDLNYRPNPSARQLKMQKAKIIGVLIPELKNNFFTELLDGIEKHAANNDYQIFLAMTHDQEEKEIRAINSMIDYGVDGFLIATIDDSESKSLKLLKKFNSPYVFVNRSPKIVDSHLIQLNNSNVGKLAAEYAIEQQFKDILFIGKERHNSIQRESAFKEKLKHSNIIVRDSLYCGYNIDLAYEVTNTYLKKNDAPEFIYAATDVQAFGAILALLNHNYRVPEDVRVLGTDNTGFAQYFKIPLSTIDGKAKDIGFGGAEILWSILQSENANKLIKKYIEPKIILRES